MKKILLIFLVSFLASTLIAQQDKEREPFLTKSLPGQAVKNVEVETSGGNISVESIRTGQARIEVFAWPSNRKNGTVLKEEIQKTMDEF